MEVLWFIPGVLFGGLFVYWMISSRIRHALREEDERVRKEEDCERVAGYHEYIRHGDAYQ